MIGLTLGILEGARAAAAGGASNNPDYYRLAYLVEATGQADGTAYATDESRHGWGVTYNGNAQITSGKFEFDGVGDYIELPHSILNTPGSMFTIEVLGLEFDAVNTGTPQTVAAHYEASSTNQAWSIAETGGNLEFRYSESGASTTAFIIGAVTTGTTYNVAICWDGTKLYAILNGAQSGSAAFTGRFKDHARTMTLGAQWGGARTLDGRFEAFIFTRGEVLYDDTSSYTMPSLPRSVDTPTLTDANWADVIALVSYDSDMARIRDYGPLDLPMTLGGNVAGADAITLGDGTPSISFDGSGDGLRLSDDALFEFGADEFTVETFARHNVSNTLQVYVNKWSSTDRGYTFQYRGADSPDNLRQYYATTSSSGNTGATGTWTPTLDSWHHVAWTRSGNDFRCFADGAQIGSTHTAADTIYNNSQPLYIGSYSGFADAMNGYLTEVRITRGARYTSGFTAPTGALPRG